MAISRVDLKNGETLIDLTKDNVTGDSLVVGHTAHSADGEIIEGTNPYELEPTNAAVNTQTSLITQIKSALANKAAGGEGLPTQEKSVEITANGTTEVLPDDGYALSRVGVNVNVPIPDGYIKPTGTKTINQNGTHDVTQYASVEVAVPDREIVLQDIEVTENGTYAAAEGYDGIGQVVVNVAAGGGGEGTNAQWFADLITDSASTVEVYNDKFEGTLSAYAFYERSNVTKIELPNLQYLKERCFYGCQNLKTLLLPGLVGYTYQYMAAGCTALVDVDIHGTNFVSSYTFQNCTSLKKVDLHRVGTIATNAFSGATKFDTLIIRTDTVPTLGGTNAFTNTKIKSGGTGYIYVKSALLDAFKAATNWSNYASQFRAIEDYPDICG